MEKSILAQELRQRQYNFGQVERRIIDALSDDDIIDSYITCSGCGEKQVTATQLEAAIEAANNAEGFFALCDQAAGAHAPQHHRRAAPRPSPRFRARQQSRNRWN